jgi:hypothetical protein
MGSMFRRGQEEAPIELLIAVTVLTFVLIIGFYAYNNACSAQFEQKMRSSISAFARALEQIYQGGVGTSYPVVIDFSSIGCASGDIDTVRLVTGDPQFCEVRLGMSDCLMLAVRIKEQKLEDQLFVAEAVNIPSTVDVNYDDQESVLCHLSDFTAGTDFEITDPHCGWKLERYLLTLKKTAPDTIEIVKG